MASSNRHWPSMFKSKPCNPHHPWQHEINPTPSLMSSGCHTTPYYSSAPGCEERTPEPKPRWNPKPEQIRILEAIFNSGTVNPPRDEIRKIRAQLQEYGQVGDANVFYWFQNRKSRSKYKLRHLQNSSKHQHQSQPHTSSPLGFENIPSLFSIAAPTSSSSSQKSSPDLGAQRTKTALSLSSPNNFLEPSNSPTSSMTQNIYLQAQDEFLSEPFLGLGGVGPHEFCFSDICNLVQVRDNSVGPCTSRLLNEIMNPNLPKKMENLNHHYHHLEEKNLMMMMMANKMQPHQLGYTVTKPTNSVAVTSTMNHVHQGEDKLGSAGAAVRSTTVFINDVPSEVAVGPFNVREAFGDELLLVRSSGEPVLTDEWGFTLQSLQHGAIYYLVRLSLSQHI